MGGPTDMFGDGYDVPAALLHSLGLTVGRKAPVLPATLSEQFESLPSRSLSSACRRLRIASSVLCISDAKLNQPI